jgi:hypothetical protein
MQFNAVKPEGGSPHSPEVPSAPTDFPKVHLIEDEGQCVAPQQLKSAGIDQVLTALRGGGSLTELPTSFYSGGYSYTHVLTTKRGAQYRVSKQVLRGVPTTALTSGGQP